MIKDICLFKLEEYFIKRLSLKKKKYFKHVNNVILSFPKIFVK